VTTVGYGDIAIGTNTEYTFAIMWMMFGVVFYSFLLGVVILIYIKHDKDEMNLNNKMKLVNYFSEKHSLPDGVTKKIKMYFNNQAKTGFADEDWSYVFSDLPPTIQTEILA